MPTIFTEGGFRFMIYIDDHAPAHVHAIGADCMIRIALQPLEIPSSVGAKASDVRRAAEIAERRGEELLVAWRNTMADPRKFTLTEDVLAKASVEGAKELERPRAKAVRYDADRVRLVIELVSDATLDIALPMTERLARATDQERGTMELTPYGLGIHWPLIDEDLYVPRLVDQYTSSLQQAA